VRSSLEDLLGSLYRIESLAKDRFLRIFFMGFELRRGIDLWDRYLGIAWVTLGGSIFSDRFCQLGLGIEKDRRKGIALESIEDRKIGSPIKDRSLRIV